MLGKDAMDEEFDYSQAFSEDNIEDWLDSPMESSQADSSQLDATDEPQKKKRRVKGPSGIDLDEPTAFELELEQHAVANCT